MASKEKEGIFSLENIPAHGLEYMEDAKTFCKQMKFRSAAVLLQEEVLEPIVDIIYSKTPKGFRRIIEFFWKDREMEKKTD